MLDRSSIYLRSPSRHLAGISGISPSGATLLPNSLPPDPVCGLFGHCCAVGSLSTPSSSEGVALEGSGGRYLGHLGLVLRVCRGVVGDPVKFFSNPGKKDLETKEEMCH